MNVGASIKRMRLRNKMEQKELAELLNVSNKTISSWEHNRTQPKMEMIEKMCEIFQCSKSDFFTEIELFKPEIDVIIENKNLGQVIVEVPRERQELFTTLNDRAKRLTSEELDQFIQMMKLFSDNKED